MNKCGCPFLYFHKVIAFNKYILSVYLLKPEHSPLFISLFMMLCKVNLFVVFYENVLFSLCLFLRLDL